MRISGLFGLVGLWTLVLVSALTSGLLGAGTARAYDADDRVLVGRRGAERGYGRGYEADYRARGVRPEVHLSLGGHGDLGAGFRVDIPIVPEGFLRRGRDDFALSPGLDIQFYDFDHDDRRWRDPGPGPRPGPGPGPRPGPAPGPRRGDRVLFIPQLAAQWNFYFPRHAWSIFPELGLAVVIGDWDGYDNVHVDPLVAFGARKHFAEHLALVMRVGWPSGFQLGLAF